MTEAKDTKDSGEAEKPKKLSLGGTLSLKVGGGSAPKPASTGNVAVEVRRSKRATPAKVTTGTAADPKAPAAKPSGDLEAKARILREAQSSGAKRTTLPRRTTLSVQKKAIEEEAPAVVDDGKPLSADDARTKEMEELKQIEAAEKSALAAKLEDGGTGRPARFTDAPAEKLSMRERMKKSHEERPAAPKKDTERKSARLTVNQALNRTYERDRGMSLAAQKRARQKARMAAKGPIETVKIVKNVIVPETITVGELSNRMTEPVRDVIKALMKMGVMATAAQPIDADTAELVIEEFGHKIRRVTDGDIEIGLIGDDDNDDNLIERPPVVTIMGHVDHGKTSLLDAFRETDVVAGEAGGITQHIGAYKVTMPSGNMITFLDTPGHAAFSEMRARGADVTDIVIIVVSAVDSIMPQTIEAIAHAKAAEVPIIIAINKIDLHDANPEKVKQDLLQYEIVVEDLGGDVQAVEVSAKQKTGLDKLEEAVLLQAEVLELRANPDREAHGFIVETKVERGRGSVATVLIQRGTLRIGHIFVAGAESGRVRALINDKGQNVMEASPGDPVEVLGISGTPSAGDAFDVVPDEARAREVADYRQHKIKRLEAAAAVQGRTTIEDLLLIRKEGEITTLPVIIKADVHGSVEALIGSFAKMEADNEGIAVKILHSGVGGISESDVTLAQSTGAFIIGFNVRANPQARDLAAREAVKVQYYNVIYNAIDDVKAILTDMLDPVEREEYIGQAKIQEVFNITKVGKIAGCIVETGFVKRGSKVRLLRDDVVIHEGMLKTLKRLKDEASEVKEGTECGMAFEKYEDLKVGDIIECFEIIEEMREVT